MMKQGGRWLMMVFLMTHGCMLNANTVSSSLAVEPCSSLSCVRNHIDKIDAQIIHLIGLRLAYAKQAWKLKQGKQSIRDQAREKQVLLNVRELALKAGYNSSIAVTIYQTLLAQTVAYEQCLQQHVCQH